MNFPSLEQLKKFISPLQILAAAVLLGLAWLVFPYRIPRLIVSFATSIVICGYLGSALFTLADIAMDSITHARLRGSSYLLPVGLVVGLVAGIFVGRIAGRTTWLYWTIQALLSALIAFWR